MRIRTFEELNRYVDIITDLVLRIEYTIFKNITSDKVPVSVPNNHLNYIIDVLRKSEYYVEIGDISAGDGNAMIYIYLRGQKGRVDGLLEEIEKTRKKLDTLNEQLARAQRYGGKE